MNETMRDKIIRYFQTNESDQKDGFAEQFFAGDDPNLIVEALVQSQESRDEKLTEQLEKTDLEAPLFRFLHDNQRLRVKSLVFLSHVAIGIGYDDLIDWSYEEKDIVRPCGAEERFSALSHAEMVSEFRELLDAVIETGKTKKYDMGDLYLYTLMISRHLQLNGNASKIHGLLIKHVQNAVESEWDAASSSIMEILKLLLEGDC